METIEVSKKDLIILKDAFEYFVEEDNYSCDHCKHCGTRYGNAALMKKNGEKLTHRNNCPVLVIQDITTGL